MGAWGTGLYSNDTAADLQLEWKDGLEQGESPEVLTERLVARYVMHPDEVAIDDEAFWLALADLQWKHGCLQEDVRDKAIAVIGVPEVLSVWTPADARARRRVHEALVDQLARVNHKPRVVRPYRRDVRWPVGSVMAYRQRDDAWLVMRVLGRLEGFGRGVAPRVQMLDWWHARLPTPSEVAELKPAPLRATTPGMEKLALSFPEAPLFGMFTERRDDFPSDRLRRIEGKVAAAVPTHDDTLLVPWRAFDAVFAEVYRRDLSTPGNVLSYRRDDGSRVYLHIGETRLASVSSDGSVYATRIEAFREPVNPSDAAAGAAELPFGTGRPWQSAEDQRHRLAELEAFVGRMADNPVGADLRAAMLGRARAEPIVEPDRTSPVATTRTGSWPLDRLTLVAHRAGTGTVPSSGSSDGPWDALDGDLDTWRF